MAEIKQEHIKHVKLIIKKSIHNKNELQKINKHIRNNNTVIKEYEKRVIELMEELDLTNLNVNDSKTGKSFNIKLDKKIKKESLSKKKIYENCLIFCKGDEEKTKTIINHLYSTEPREDVLTEKIVYKPIKE